MVWEGLHVFTLHLHSLFPCCANPFIHSFIHIRLLTSLVVTRASTTCVSIRVIDFMAQNYEEKLHSYLSISDEILPHISLLVETERD